MMPKSATKGGKPPMQEMKTNTWVQEMHQHFNATGAYRAVDIHRVLGDQAKHVDVQVSTEPRIAARLSEKST
jgi:hypothetical protein